MVPLILGNLQTHLCLYMFKGLESSCNEAKGPYESHYVPPTWNSRPYHYIDPITLSQCIQGLEFRDQGIVM